jgi:hypothetical protein
MKRLLYAAWPVLAVVAVPVALAVALRAFGPEIVCKYIVLGIVGAFVLAVLGIFGTAAYLGVRNRWVRYGERESK